MNFESSLAQQGKPADLRQYANAGSTVPPQPGISSALKELFEEIGNNSDLTESIRSSFGISCPADGANKASEASLFEAIRSATYRVRQANGNLRDVLQHLNG